MLYVRRLCTLVVVGFSFARCIFLSGCRMLAYVATKPLRVYVACVSESVRGRIPAFLASFSNT